MGNALSVILALLLGIAWFATDEIFYKKARRYNARQQITSFSAGVITAYLFLELLPSTIMRGETLGAIALLVGFSISHLIEKTVRQQEAKRHSRKIHKMSHAVFLFIYFVIIGVILVEIVTVGVNEALLFFFPFFFYIMIEYLPKHLQFRTKGPLILLSGAPVIGTLFASMVQVPFVVNSILVGLVSGAIFYVVPRESIPLGKKGAPIYFLIGVVLYAIFIFSLARL